MKLELQNLFRSSITEKFNSYSQGVFSQLGDCHTAAMGYHSYRCEDSSCDQNQYRYHCCGNRHCPNCGALKREQWVEEQLSCLVPTSYYHIVFTIPEELRIHFLRDRKPMFDMLFRAGSQTLLTIARDPKYLGGTPGITSMLHSWGQNLSFHPHIHCVVSGGGIDSAGNWVAEKRKNHNYLFPKAILQKVYKGIFLKELRTYHQAKGEGNDHHGLYKQLGEKRWNVYAKAPFIHNANNINTNSLSRIARDGGPEQVVKYLGRYSHKIAITSHRIQAVTDSHIRFEYKDYQDNSKVKSMTLSHEEFLRRFEQHILPFRYVKIRHYGYMSPNGRVRRIEDIHRQLSLSRPMPRLKISLRQRMLELTGTDITLCPRCQKSKLIPTDTKRRHELEPPKTIPNPLREIDHHFLIPP
jgi:hypothetical protein